MYFCNECGKYFDSDFEEVDPLLENSFDAEDIYECVDHYKKGE